MTYLLTRQFQKNQVFDLLEETDYTRVISLSIGHGWTRAGLYTKEESAWKETVLKLDDKGHTCIPTRISYDPSGENEAIGYEADPASHRRQFFLPPQNWDKTSPDGSHTFKTLMEDFLCHVWFVSIPDNNPEGDTDDGENTLLVVGCPFSGDWLGTDDFRALVADATLHDHVLVLPESLAALDQAALPGHTPLSEGAALFDLGTVTTDFLYISQGKKLIARTLEWGGNQVDRALLDEILKVRGMTRKDIPLSALTCVLDQVRIIKEGFDPSQPPCTHTITLGDTPGHSFDVTVDTALMDQAITSVLPQLENFFHQMKNRIGSRPCSAVILTGGASLTRKLPELVMQVFGSEYTLLHPEEPARCVVRGLGQTACRRLQIKAPARQQHSTICSYLDARYEGLRLQCTDMVLGSFCCVASRQLQRIRRSEKQLRLSQIVSSIETAVKGVGLPEDQKLSWHLRDVSEDLLKILSPCMQELTQNTQQTDVNALLHDTQQALDTALSKVDLNALTAQILGQTNFTKLFFFSYIDEDILKHYHSMMYRGARSAAAAFTALFSGKSDYSNTDPDVWRSSGPFLHYPELLDEGALAQQLMLLVNENCNQAQYYINLEKKNPTIDSDTLDRILKHNPPEDHLTDWHKRHMDAALDNCPMLPQIYQKLFRDLYEITLGKMLLLVFDQRADIP